MKLLVKIVATLAVVALVAFGAVFTLAKAKVAHVNEWLVDEGRSVIGVDLSEYQADVDMAVLKGQGIEFAYLKASEGSSHRDSRFAQNWANAQAAGLPAGAYHFFSYDSPGSNQAKNFIEAVGPELHGRLLPAVDVEYYGDKETNPPAKADVVRELRAFIDALESQYGVKPIIYTRADIHDKYLAGEFDAYPIWMASFYAPIWLSYRGDWTIWQYLDNGRLEGYSGGEELIDLDVLAEGVSVEDLLVP